MPLGDQLSRYQSPLTQSLSPPPPLLPPVNPPDPLPLHWVDKYYRREKGFDPSVTTGPNPAPPPPMQPPTPIPPELSLADRRAEARRNFPEVFDATPKWLQSNPIDDQKMLWQAQWEDDTRRDVQIVDDWGNPKYHRGRQYPARIQKPKLPPPPR